MMQGGHVCAALFRYQKEMGVMTYLGKTGNFSNPNESVYQGIDESG